MTKPPSPETASLVVLPNVLCRQQNQDRYHNDQCGDLRSRIIGEAAFVARRRIHMGLPPSGIIVPEALWELTRSRSHRCFATCYRSLDTEFFDLRIKHQLFTCDQGNVQEAPAAPIKSLPRNALNKAMSFEKSGPNSREIISLAYQQGAVAGEIAGSLVRHVRPPFQIEYVKRLPRRRGYSVLSEPRRGARCRRPFLGCLEIESCDGVLMLTSPAR
jgi:hypothetical protein